MTERINVRASRFVTRPIDGLMSPQEIVTAMAGGGSTVAVAQTQPMGGSPYERGSVTTFGQRLSWALFGPPDTVKGFTDATQRAGGMSLRERLRWILFGPQHVWRFAPAVKLSEAEQRDRTIRHNTPGLNPYGFVSTNRATDGMAVIWADGFGKMPNQIYPTVTPSIAQTDVQPYVYTRTLWPVFDKWWPARYDANTLLGYNPYTGLGLQTAGEHVYPGDTTPPLANAGQGQQFPSPIVRAVLRVPRYSTQPQTITPRDSP